MVSYSRIICSSLLLFHVSQAFQGSSEQSDTVQVKIDSGPIRGYIASEGQNQAVVFKGIPFAKPPVGDLRWRPPQSPEPWSDVKDTTEFSRNCMQGRQNPNRLSEDCLYLNVYAPHSNQGKQNGTESDEGGLPVLFWIYGGGFQQGGADATRLNGTWVTLQNQNIVIVTINYRLNVFGFLSAEELRERDTAANSTGNYGIQDQRLAMQWVQNNIAVFGGDPDRVLIVGQSAGAQSVSEHLVRSQSWGLFARAGMESGAYADERDQPTVAQQRDIYLELVKQANCESSADAVQCLLNVDAGTLVQLDTSISSPKAKWQPTVDDVELVKPAIELAQDGHFAPGVPFLVGSVSEDLNTYGHSSCNPNSCNADDFLTFAKQNVGLNDSAAAELQQLYSDEVALPGGSFTAWYWAQVHAGADAWAGCPARRAARWSTDSPGREQNPQNAYLYYWSYVPMGPNGKYPQLAHHACEQPFIFHVLSETPSEEASDGGSMHIDASEIPFSNTIVDLWTSFAANGKPTADGVNWPAFKDANQTLHIAQHSIAPEENLRGARCDFWDRLFDENLGVPRGGWSAASLRLLLPGICVEHNVTFYQ